MRFQYSKNLRLTMRERDRAHLNSAKIDRVMLSETLCASFLHGKVIPQTQNNFQSSSATYA